MRKFLPALVWILLASACGTQPAAEAIPADVLSREVMTDVLVDLQIAESTAQADMVPENYQFRRDRMFLDILNTYNTDSTQFRKSMEFYTSHPKELVKLYEAVQVKINTL